ncbi:YhbD family protein [Paenibacillus qinlingensis]|uniref:Transcriptional regulator with XRE-family HTH domain n=1 Tax=Paenibacillus qinlingensis TaxID=1837343 RepID=A0ABU1P568_9BACL|nr:YhbD family protein [Paenibacillus qinlingensis]MDR6554496.1 transcriptional regulator with XRE-family HTH domain [Paenibacillus qinlingensis]
MEEDLISKKELLELTGISYGQLYRWKRKNLVPEEWFIRKSAFTGQETFFPKGQMLARIDKILNMKDDLSLDELADVFSIVPSDLRIDKLELVKRNIVSLTTIEYASPFLGATAVYSFEETLFLFLLEDCLQTGEMSLDEGKHLLLTMKEQYDKFEGKPCDLIFIRKMGLTLFFLVTTGCELFCERGAKIVLRVQVAKKIEELKLKMTTM